jgi:hypothetical protein
MIEPDSSPGGSRWAATVRRAVPTLVVVAALGGLAGIAVTAVSVGAAQAQAPPPPGLQPPGLRPPVQSWLKDREAEQIELNNALVAIVQKQVGDPRAVKAACPRLAAAVDAMSGQSAAPEQQVDRLTRAGLGKFKQASVVCLAGDVATAERLVTEGLAQRAAAQEPLDQVLDGD